MNTKLIKIIALVLLAIVVIGLTQRFLTTGELILRF
jgi:hypothetical protein